MNKAVSSPVEAETNYSFFTLNLCRMALLYSILSFVISPLVYLKYSHLFLLLNAALFFLNALAGLLCLNLKQYRSYVLITSCLSNLTNIWLFYIIIFAGQVESFKYLLIALVIAQIQLSLHFKSIMHAFTVFALLAFTTLVISQNNETLVFPDPLEMGMIAIVLFFISVAIIHFHRHQEKRLGLSQSLQKKILSENQNIYLNNISVKHKFHALSTRLDMAMDLLPNSHSNIHSILKKTAEDMRESAETLNQKTELIDVYKTIKEAAKYYPSINISIQEMDIQLYYSNIVIHTLFFQLFQCTKDANQDSRNPLVKTDIYPVSEKSIIVHVRGKKDFKSDSDAYLELEQSIKEIPDLKLTVDRQENNTWLELSFDDAIIYKSKNPD